MVKDYEAFAEWLSTIIDDADLAAFKQEVEKQKTKQGEEYDAEKHVDDYIKQKGKQTINDVPGSQRSEKRKAQSRDVLIKVSKQVSSLENTYGQTKLDTLAEEVYAQKGRVKGDTLQTIKTTSKDTDAVIKNNANKIVRRVELEEGIRTELDGTIQDYLASFRDLEQVKGTKQSITQKLDDYFLTKELTRKKIIFDKNATLSEKKKLAKDNKIELGDLYERKNSLKGLRKIARENRVNIAPETDLNKVLHKTLIIQTMKDNNIFESRKELKDKIDSKLLTQALAEKGVRVDKDASPNMLRKIARENKINVKILYNREKYSPNDSSEKLVVMANKLGIKLSKTEKKFTDMSYEDIQRLNKEHKLNISKKDYAGRINQIERTLNSLAKKTSLNAAEMSKKQDLTFELNNIKSTMKRTVEQNNLHSRLKNSFKSANRLLTMQPYQKQYARETVEDERAKDFVVNLKKDLNRLIKDAEVGKEIDQTYKTKMFELSRNLSPNIKSSAKKEIEYLFNRLNEADVERFKKLPAHQDLFKKRTLLEKKQLLLLKSIDSKNINEKEVDSLIKKEGLSLFRRKNEDIDEKIVTVARLTNAKDDDFTKAVNKLKQNYDSQKINTTKLLNNTLEAFTQKEIDVRKKPSPYLTLSELFKMQEQKNKNRLTPISFSKFGREEFSYLDKPIKKKEIDAEISKIKGAIGKTISKSVTRTPQTYNPKDIDRLAFLNLLDKRSDLPILELELEKQWKKKKKIAVDVPLNFIQRKEFLKELSSKQEVDKLIKKVKGPKAKFLKKYNFLDVKPFRDTLREFVNQEELFFKLQNERMKAEEKRKKDKDALEKTNNIIKKINEIISLGTTKEEILETGINIPKGFDLDKAIINNRVRQLYKTGVSETELLETGISKTMLSEIIEDVERRRKRIPKEDSTDLNKKIGRIGRTDTKLLNQIKKRKV